VCAFFFDDGTLDFSPEAFVFFVGGQGLMRNYARAIINGDSVTAALLPGVRSMKRAT